MNKSRDKIDEGVTEDDINEIKQDISSFRYELLEVRWIKAFLVYMDNISELRCGCAIVLGVIERFVIYQT